VLLPIKRAASLWLDTHSQYYPFQGELLPLSSLDSDIHQQYWLPFFALLTAAYTSLGLIGVWLLWRDESSRRWLLLIALLVVPRMVMLSLLENPEPRYVVEFFAFVAPAAALAVVAAYDRSSAALRRRLETRTRP
jgi:4-amino-4-deoxy-L-arabinose transferase-like glycosyltransferase